MGHASGKFPYQKEILSRGAQISPVHLKLQDHLCRTPFEKEEHGLVQHNPWQPSLTRINEAHLLESKYDKVDLQEVAKNQEHLELQQQAKLLKVLTDNKEVFQGTIGAWCGPKIDIELQQGVRPYHTKPYCVPHSILPVFKSEVARLVEIGILLPNPDSKWAAPSFAIPKKDGQIRFVTDFC